MDASPQPGTRDRLIAAMAGALQRRGLHGVGLNELLDRAGAPKGVLYHHFPGGKTELAIAAIEAMAERVCAALDRVIAGRADPVDALRQWLETMRRQLEDSDFERGCPLATVALESTADDVALRAALTRAFQAVRGRLADVFAVAGAEPAAAAAMAALVVSAYEGGLLQARVAGSSQPMADTTAILLDLLEQRLTGTRVPA
jgi:TetR/AcrR family transcriptional repressor of lmrAB and yxaGH operons